MACVTKQQWAEVYNKEKTRLYKMQDEGYSIDKALDDLEAMNDRFQAGKIQEAKKIAMENAKQFTDISRSDIARVNKNKPKTSKGAPLKVVRGWKDAKGNVTYVVKYPNSETEYHMAAELVHLDQMDAKYGVVFGNDPKSHAYDKVTKYHEELKTAIWNDQDAALTLFDYLEGLDENPDVEHNKELKELLTEITDPTKKILNKFKVYLDKEAEENSGIAVPYGKDPKMILNIAPSMMKAEMSPTEMYLHEMLHMSIEVAKEFKKGQIADEISELGRLYELVARKVKPKDLVENGDTARAQRMWDYMFSNEDSGLSEFIAYAMTNKKFKEQLKKISASKEKSDLANSTVWDKIARGIVKIYEAIASLVRDKKENDSVDERIGKLVTEIWLHNNQTIDKSSTMARMKEGVDRYQGVADDVLRSTASKLTDIAGKVLDKTIEVSGDSVVGTVAKGIKVAALTLNPYESEKMKQYTSQARREMELALDGTGLDTMLAADGWIMPAVNYLKEDDSDTTFVERLGLIAQNIDKYREMTIEQIGKSILSKLKNVKHKEQIALTKALIETDMKVLMKDFALEQIAELLQDDSKVQEEIERLEQELGEYESDTRYNNYYKAQANGLGLYMATGLSSSSLNMNAKEIADMDYTEYWRNGDKKENREYKKNRSKIIEIVDKIATLAAIKNANASAKSTAAQTIAKHPEGAMALMDYHALHNASEVIYKAQHYIHTRTVKGEIKDLKASYIEQIIHSNSEDGRAEMKREGFKYVGPSNVDGYGVYRKFTSGMESFDKQAVAKINEAKEMQNVMALKSRGTAIDDEFGLEGFREIKKINTNAEEQIKKQMETGEMGTFDGYIGLIEGNYKVGNYAVSVDKEMYADMMEQDKRAPVLIAKMIAEIQEKDMSSTHNLHVMEAIYEDMRVNYKVRGEVGAVNRMEYIEIGPDAQNKGRVAQATADRIWKDMPDNIKKRILAGKNGYKYIAVRRDMSVMYFGRRAPSVLQARIRLAGDKTVEQIARGAGLGFAVEAIKLATDIWQELVSLTKVGIVLKTPMVVINNVISNFNYSVALGQAPWKVAQMQVKMFKATKEYIDMEKKAIKLKFEIDRGVNAAENRAELKRLKIKMKENAVAPLVENGLFTAVLEDLRLKDLQANTRIGAAVDKYVEKVPTLVRDTFATLYVTQDSQLFGMMMMATTYGDFVARANRFYFLMEQGHTKEQALKLVTDEFVNYNRDLGAFMVWMKNMGFMQFFQYLFGAMKSMAQKFKTNPAAMLLMNGFLDLPNPGDAMPFQRDIMTNMHSPWDILTNQVPEFIPNPALLRAVGVTIV